MVQADSRFRLTCVRDRVAFVVASESALYSIVPWYTSYVIKFNPVVDNYLGKRVTVSLSPCHQLLLECSAL